MGALVLFFVCAGILAGTARAADSIFWAENVGGRILRANLTGGGTVAKVPFAQSERSGLSGVTLDAAAGRLYWAENDPAPAIMVANLNGSGTRPLNTAGAELTAPDGLAIDTRGGRIYWADERPGDPGRPRTINYANLDGSGGGVLNTTGASIQSPRGLAVYPAAGRIYWADRGGKKISFANLDGSGGGTLGIDPAGIESPVGVAVDAAAQRIYWTDQRDNEFLLRSASLGGGPVISLTPSAIEDPFGLAFDTAANRAYWTQGDSLVGFASSLDGSGGFLDVAGIPASTVAISPVLLKAPVSTGAAAMTVSRGRKDDPTLTCASSWLPDAPEAQLFRAAQTISAQWLRDGKPIPGATQATLRASAAGTYTCQGVATNGAGSTGSEPSTPLTVPASLKLGKVKLNRKKGTATIAATVNAAGRLAATGKGVGKAMKLAKRSGTYRLTVRAAGKAKRQLLAGGRARLKVKVTFAPRGGKALKQSKTVVLEQR